MRRLLPFLIVLGVSALPLSHTATAQIEVHFSGYALDLPVYQRINTGLAQLGGIARDQYSNLTRVRLRPSLIPWSNGALSVEYEITGLYRTTEFTPFGDIERPTGQLAGLSWTLIEGPDYVARHFIDRLYFKQMVSDLGEVIVGRQRVSMGTGRIWNPTDLFNPINPANFAKIEKDGVDAITTRVYLGELSDVSLIYNPYNDFRERSIGIRFRGNAEAYDYSALVGRFGDRAAAGIDFAGNFFDAGLRGEGIYSSHAVDDPANGFVKFILGIDYQFTPDLYGLLEYHYNGEGKRDRSEYELVRLFQGSILNVGTQYLAVLISSLPHPLVNVSATSIGNLIDASGILGITATYSFAAEAALIVGGQATYGRDGSEYWYYPASAYLQVEYHF
jgi:hypothetical protein